VVATDPLLPISSIDPLVTLMSESISQQRLLAQLATGYGVLALVLAAIGLYGVMTYAISRRTNEIGLRVALGADRGQIVRMVLRDALRLVAAGVAIGVPLALGAARLLESQLHGVNVGDPYSLGLAVIVLTAAAIVAALVPARRAANVAPLVIRRSRQRVSLTRRAVIAVDRPAHEVVAENLCATRIEMRRGEPRGRAGLVDDFRDDANRLFWWRAERANELGVLGDGDSEQVE